MHYSLFVPSPNLPVHSPETFPVSRADPAPTVFGNNMELFLGREFTNNSPHLVECLRRSIGDTMVPGPVAPDPHVLFSLVSFLVQ